MKSLTYRTLTPLYLLYQEIGKFRPTNKQKIAEILTNIEAENSLAVAPHLVPLALKSNRWVATAVSHTIHHLIKNASAIELFHLDVIARRYQYLFHPAVDAWPKIKPENVKKAHNLGETAVSILGVLSLHMNGFVRETAVDDFLHALQSPSPGVSRIAKKALLNIGAQRTLAAMLWKIFLDSPYTHTKHNALHLLTNLSKWDTLHYLLSALPLFKEHQSDLIERLDRWLNTFNNSFISPSTTQIQNVQTLMQNIDHLLPQRLQDNLMVIIKSISS